MKNISKKLFGLIPIIVVVALFIASPVYADDGTATRPVCH